MQLLRQVVDRLQQRPSRDAATPAAGSSLHGLHLATVLDTMSESCFGAEARITPVTVDGWREQLKADAPDLLLVESAWRGSGGSWEYKVGSYAYPDSRGLPDLKQLVRWCRNHDVPTVFWNKEDPVHFAKFREAARLFDVVFTTDADMVERYTQLKGAQAAHVAPLAFAAQPALHNPVALDSPRDPRPCFAGTFYRNRHEDRRRQLEMLLDAARPYDLVVYDRMHGKSGDTFGFPERFGSHILGSLPYAEMNVAYKRFRVFLNANSVVDSPTMFSRRVFELLACGTPVVSTPSAGVQRLFGDVVATVETPEEARLSIDRLLHDDDHWAAVAGAGVRRVFAEHTYAHRLATIARAAGLDVAEPQDPFTLLWVGDDADAVRRLCAAVEQQSQRPAELLVCWSGKEIPVGELAALERVVGPGGVQLVPIAAGTEGQGHAAGARAATHAWLVVLDGQDLAPTTLQDLAVCRQFTDADAIGVASRRQDRHRYGPAPEAPVLVRTALVNRTGWPLPAGGNVRGYAI